jgi:hypothetical protein
VVSYMQIRAGREGGLFQADKTRVSGFLHADEGMVRSDFVWADSFLEADKSRVQIRAG